VSDVPEVYNAVFHSLTNPAALSGVGFCLPFCKHFVVEVGKCEIQFFLF
jgi:hypothetical protein